MQWIGFASASVITIMYALHIKEKCVNEAEVVKAELQHRGADHRLH